MRTTRSAVSPIGDSPLITFLTQRQASRLIENKYGGIDKDGARDCQR